MRTSQHCVPDTLGSHTCLRDDKKSDLEKVTLPPKTFKYLLCLLSQKRKTLRLLVTSINGDGKDIDVKHGVL